MLGRNGSHCNFKLKNPHFNNGEFLYHLGIKADHSSKQKFGDVKFVCMGGKESRMKYFAEMLFEGLGKPQNSEFEGDGSHVLANLSKSAGRYAMYKVGPVISVNHGIGAASLSIVLHELFKLIHFAQCDDVTFFRIGSSGGLGLEAGTVVVTKQAFNGMLQPFYRQVTCGVEHKYDTKTDTNVSQSLLNIAKSLRINAVHGNTVSTNDFYEEQGRLDGAFCEYTNEDKMKFIREAYSVHGVRNIEMESSCFAALCSRAGLKCAVVCVVYLDRLHGDSVTSDNAALKTYDTFPLSMVAEYVKTNM